jgi:hypothetical protein
VLFGLEPWGAARCSSWIRSAVGLFLEGCQAGAINRRLVP